MWKGAFLEEIEEYSVVSGRRIFILAVVLAAIVAIFMPRHAGTANYDLTKSEQDWLRAHPVIRLGTVPDWPPISMRDNEGKLSGIVGDYRELIERNSRIHFSIMPEIPYGEVLGRARSGEIDVIMLLGRTPERDQYLLFTTPLFDLPYVIITRNDKQGIHSLSTLAGKKVSVRENMVSHEWLLAEHHELTVVPKKNVVDALQAVISGEVDAFVGGTLPSSYEIAEHGMSGLKVVASADYINKLRIGVRKDWPELVSILNKTLAAIPEEKHHAVLSLWTNLQPRGISPLTVAWIVAGLGFLIAVSLLYGNIRLRRSYDLVDEKVRERTEQLNKLNESLIESEMTLSNAQKLSHLGNWDMDIQTQKGQWSDETYRILGFEPGAFEPTFDKFMGSVHPEDKKSIEKLMVEMLSGKRQNAEFDLRIIRPGGEDRDVFVNISVLTGEDGKPVKLIGTIYDITERKATERNLRESEERYRQAFQESGAVKLLIEADSGKIADANGAACRFYGYSREELISKHITDINIHSPEEIRAAMDAIRGEKKGYFIFRHRLASGALRDVEVYSSPVKIGGKTFLHSIIHDITDRKKSEAIIRCRAELSELAAGASLDELIQSGLDMAERQTFSQIAFFHFIEEDQENLKLQTWSTNTLENMCNAEGKGTHYSISKAGVWVDSFHKRTTVVYNDYAGLTHKKGMPEGHAPVTRVLSIPVIKEGKVRVIMGVGNKKTDYDQNDIDMAEQTASILYDLVQRKKVQEELNESELHFRLLVEFSPFCIHEIGLDGRILSMNRAGLDMLRLKNEAEVAGVAYLTSVGGGDRKRIGNLLSQAYKGVSSHFEFASSSKEPRVFKSCFIPITDANGTVVKLMGITEDITERKRWERELLEAKKNAESANNLKDKFVSLVSHDLLAPLSGILGFLKLVRTEPIEKLGENPRKMVDFSISSGENMVLLIRDILSLSRLRTGAIKPKMEFFDVDLIGKKMMVDYQYASESKGIILENRIPNNTRVYSDKTLLTEVIQNFVTNAIKFCREGDRVAISVEKGDKTIVWVTDTGQGIDPSLKQKLVDNEGYSSTKGTGGEKGSGYGLIITKEMLDALGGELLIETEPGKGCRFGARIPFVRPKILLVDYDANFRAQMRKSLDAVDADISEADDGMAAIETFDGVKNLPNLIISNIETPRMSGLGLLSHLQMRGETKSIPVFIISGKHGLEKQATVYGLGAKEYLLKPLDVDDFINRVRMYVG